jgi:excisionase family DNA binding protein
VLREHTIEEAAERLGKSTSTIRRMIKSGELASQLKGGKYLILLEVPDESEMPSQDGKAGAEHLVTISSLRVENARLAEENAYLRGLVERMTTQMGNAVITLSGENVRREVQLALPATTDGHEGAREHPRGGLGELWGRIRAYLR